MSGTTSGGTVIGSGSDSIVLNMSEDAAAGTDAAFTVNVDGQQIGGEQTVTASHSAGQDQTFTFEGNWAPGQHNVTVTFANNFLYPGTSGDRNVYVDRVTYDGQTISSTTTPIYVSPLFPPNSTNGDNYGNAVFQVNDTTAVPSGAGPNPTTTPGAVSVGSGSDTLVLNMAEDPYQGDAQFTVAVDGKQIGGTQTTTANVEQGQQQEFDVHGNFGGGSHTVTVTYLNDQIGDFYPAGTPGIPSDQQYAVDTTDRNLYVMSASLDGGSPAGGAPWELSSDGSHDFYVTSGNNQSVGAGSAASASTSSDATTGSTSSGTPTASTSSDTTTGSSSGTTTGSSSGTTTGSTDTTGASTTSSGTSQTSDTATVSSASLSSGSSSGNMTFVAPSGSSSSSNTSGSNGSSDSSSGSSGSSADTGAAVTAAASGSQSTPDTTSTPTSGSTSSSTDTSQITGGSGSSSHYWHNHSGSYWGAHWAATHSS